MSGKRTGIVASLKARGFDLSHAVPFEKGATLGCSQCEALAINGVAVHERGCPNDTKECKGCPNPIPARGRDYCGDCV